MKISLKSGKAAWVRRWSMFGVVALMSMVCVDAALAQSVASGTIEGTVKDESNAVLPGVTVTVTSPQLQVGQLVQVSDAAGTYKFVDLPAGTYRLRAELTGFSSCDSRRSAAHRRLQRAHRFHAEARRHGGVGHRQRAESGRRRHRARRPASRSRRKCSMRFRAAATCRTCLRWRPASRRRSPMSAAARWRSARTCPATACCRSRSCRSRA